MTFAHRYFFLEVPEFLKNQRILFRFILIANDVAWVRCRYPQKLLLYIGDQFAAFNLGQGNFHRFLVLYLVVLALSRNAPSPQASDFGIGVKWNSDYPIFPAARTQNLVRHTDYPFH